MLNSKECAIKMDVESQTVETLELLAEKVKYVKITSFAKRLFDLGLDDGQGRKSERYQGSA